MKNWKNYVLLLTIALLAAAVAPKAQSVYSSPVTVTNTPLAVDTDNNARHAVRLTLIGVADVTSVPMHDANTSLPYTVPTGKRLVIEHASLFANPPVGEKAYAYWSNGLTLTALPATLQIDTGAVSAYEGSVSLRDYVDAGNQVGFSIFDTSGNWPLGWEVDATGYLIDCNGQC
jgi:hypothetical protein